MHSLTLRIYCLLATRPHGLVIHGYYTNTWISHAAPSHAACSHTVALLTRYSLTRHIRTPTVVLLPWHLLSGFRSHLYSRQCSLSSRRSPRSITSSGFRHEFTSIIIKRGVYQLCNLLGTRKLLIASLSHLALLILPMYHRLFVAIGCLKRLHKLT